MSKKREGKKREEMGERKSGLRGNAARLGFLGGGLPGKPASARARRGREESLGEDLAAVSDEEAFGGWGDGVAAEVVGALVLGGGG